MPAFVVGFLWFGARSDLSGLLYAAAVVFAAFAPAAAYLRDDLRAALPLALVAALWSPASLALDAANAKSLSLLLWGLPILQLITLGSFSLVLFFGRRKAV